MKKYNLTALIVLTLMSNAGYGKELEDFFTDKGPARDRGLAASSGTSRLVEKAPATAARILTSQLTSQERDTQVQRIADQILPLIPPATPIDNPSTEAEKALSSIDWQTKERKNIAWQIAYACQGMEVTSFRGLLAMADPFLVGNKNYNLSIIKALGPIAARQGLEFAQSFVDHIKTYSSWQHKNIMEALSPVAAKFGASGFSTFLELSKMRELVSEEYCPSDFVRSLSKMSVDKGLESFETLELQLAKFVIDMRYEKGSVMKGLAEAISLVGLHDIDQVVDKAMTLTENRLYSLRLIEGFSKVWGAVEAHNLDEFSSIIMPFFNLESLQSSRLLKINMEYDAVAVIGGFGKVFQKHGLSGLSHFIGVLTSIFEGKVDMIGDVQKFILNTLLDAFVPCLQAFLRQDQTMKKIYGPTPKM